MPMSKNRKRVLALVAAGAAVTGVIASAASLGGITAQSLGADTTVVASCDTNGVTLNYGTVYAAPQYNVNSVTVGSIDAACNGKAIKVTLANAANASLVEVTGVVAAGAFTGAVGGTVSAAAVENAAIVISG